MQTVKLFVEGTSKDVPKDFFFFGGGGGGGGGGGEILREINGQDHQTSGSVRAYAQSGHGHCDLLSA